MSEPTTTPATARAHLCAGCPEARIEGAGTIRCIATVDRPGRALCQFLTQGADGHIHPHYVQTELDPVEDVKSRQRGKSERVGGTI